MSLCLGPTTYRKLNITAFDIIPLQATLRRPFKKFLLVARTFQEVEPVSRSYYSLMRCDIEEQMGVLRGGVLGPVGRWEGHHQQHWFAGEAPLGSSQERDGVVGDQVWVVVLE